MSFYIRKSIKIGPLRFNLSKSGIGVSAGVKGFRLGSGPRGNYVHMGRGGLYYRKTLPSTKKKPKNSTNAQYLEEASPINEQTQLQKIESAHISQMIDSSSEDLVKELNNKKKKVNIWPFVIVISIITTFFVYKKTGNAMVAFLCLCASSLITFATVLIDRMKKTTVLFFDFEPEIESFYQNLCNVFDKISSTSKKWRIDARGEELDKKRNAGANSIISRNEISVGNGIPPNIKTNIPIPYILMEKKSLYFFPDKLIVFDQYGIGAVSYQNLTISAYLIKFVEEDNVPGDTEIIDSTWKYINKRGGPDKRFKDNCQLPIVLYEEIDFKSNTGLNEKIQLSKIGLGDELSSSIALLSASFKKAV